MADTTAAARLAVTTTSVATQHGTLAVTAQLWALAVTTERGTLAGCLRSHHCTTTQRGALAVTTQRLVPYTDAALRGACGRHTVVSNPAQAAQGALGQHGGGLSWAGFFDTVRRPVEVDSGPVLAGTTARLTVTSTSVATQHGTLAVTTELWALAVTTRRSTLAGCLRSQRSTATQRGALAVTTQRLYLYTVVTLRGACGRNTVVSNPAQAAQGAPGQHGGGLSQTVAPHSRSQHSAVCHSCLALVHVVGRTRCEVSAAASVARQRSCWLIQQQPQDSRSPPHRLQQQSTAHSQ